MRLPDMNHKKIQRIMRKYGLVAKVRKRNPHRAARKKTMQHRVFPNKLQRAFKQLVPFKVFCTDITYLPFQGRFIYVSVIKDISSGDSGGLELFFVFGDGLGDKDDQEHEIGFIRKHHDSFRPGISLHQSVIH